MRVNQEGAHPVATLASTRGDILARMGRNREAEAAFRDEIAHFPTTTDAYTRLALLLASERRFTEIEPTLEAMVKASPKPASRLASPRSSRPSWGLPTAWRSRRTGASWL